MLLAVREQPVDDHAHDGEDEDDETPKKLVHGRTVRLEDFDCKGTSVSVVYEQERKQDCVLQTRMSRMRMIKPMIPPPVPYCHGLALVASTPPSARGAAKASEASQSWRKEMIVAENMAMLVLLSFSGVRKSLGDGVEERKRMVLCRAVQAATVAVLQPR